MAVLADLGLILPIFGTQQVPHWIGMGDEFGASLLGRSGLSGASFAGPSSLA
jgi:hypothetical protein